MVRGGVIRVGGIWDLVGRCHWEGDGVQAGAYSGF